MRRTRPPPAITTLPPISPSARWVYPKRRRLRHVNSLHIAHRAVEVTLCGRVRPGEPADGKLPAGFHLCPRCVYRAAVLWMRI